MRLELVRFQNKRFIIRVAMPVLRILQYIMLDSGFLKIRIVFDRLSSMLLGQFSLLLLCSQINSLVIPIIYRRVMLLLQHLEADLIEQTLWLWCLEDPSMFIIH